MQLRIIPNVFLGFGFFLCSLCSSKHCMIYQRLENSLYDCCRFPQSWGATCMKVFSCSKLMPDGVGSGAWVRSYLQTGTLWWSHVWRDGRDSSLIEARVLHQLPIFSISLSLVLFLSCLSPPLKCHLFFLPPINPSFTSPLFWPCSDSRHQWWGTEVM